MNFQTWSNRFRAISVCIAVILTLGCAGANRPPESGAPRGGGDEPYPLVFAASAERATTVNSVWNNYLKAQGQATPPPPDLQPITSTIRSAGADNGVILYLPKVGSGATMSDDEKLESLRRFVDATKILIGSEQEQQLSLKSVTPGTQGTAIYQQEPFRYPLRNGYGVVRIGFAADRHITEFSSTCIPLLPGLLKTLVNLKTNVTQDGAAATVSGRNFTYNDANGPHQFTVNAGEPVSVRQLVVFPMPASDGASLYLHLSWEIDVGPQFAHRVYVDAVTSEVLGSV